MNSEFAIIINSFNRLSLLRKAITNLLNIFGENQMNVAIMVVDAGSKDGSIEFINDIKAQTSLALHLVLSDQDTLSFSSGCNLGVATALHYYPDLGYILLFETDNYLKSIRPIHEALELIKIEKSAACVGFTVEKHSGQKIAYGSSKPSVLSHVLGQTMANRLGLDVNKEKWRNHNGLVFSNAPIIFTSPLLITTKAWINVKGMTPEVFPFSDSDADLCLKFIAHGYQNLVLKCDGVVHDNLNTLSAWSSKRVLDYQKARYRLIKHHQINGHRWMRSLLLVKYKMELALGSMLGKDDDFISNRQILYDALKNSFSEDFGTAEK